MGAALAGGLVAASWCAASDLLIVESSSERRGELLERVAGVRVVADLALEDVDASTGAVVCVKPDHAESAARTLAACGVTRVLSVVAGLSTQRLEAVFPFPVPVVRAMPNTAVLVGRGASAIAGGSHVSAADLE